MALSSYVCVGRFTADPELRVVGEEQHEIVTFTLAVDRDMKNEDGSRTADFLDFVAWRGTAKFICRNFRKGSCVTVSNSRPTTRNYTTKDGQKKHVVEFAISAKSDIYFYGSKPRDDRSQMPSGEDDCEDLPYGENC